MSPERPPQPQRPAWASVTREHVPAAPRNDQAPVPVPIDVDTDSDIIRPVNAPPPEETFPTSADNLPGGLQPQQVSPYSAFFDGSADNEDAPPVRDSDSVRELGQFAVTNASFLAAGAQTPMSGIPRVAPKRRPDSQAPVNAPLDLPQFSEDEERFVPRFEPAVGLVAAAQPSVSFSSTDASEPTASADDGAHTGAVPDNQVTTSENPRVADSAPIESSTPADHGPTEPPYTADDDSSSTPWWLSVAALVVYGVIILAVVAYVVASALFTSETVTIEPEVLVEGPAAPDVTPIELEDPTPFLQGVPLTTPTHALANVVSHDVSEIDAPAGRVAEAHDLTYSNGTTDYTVRAYHHFSEADAQQSYDALAEGSTDTAEVVAAGEVVGERAILTTDDGTVIVWRNSATVLSVTGPEEGIAEFYDLFGW